MGRPDTTQKNATIGNSIHYAADLEATSSRLLQSYSVEMWAVLSWPDSATAPAPASSAVTVKPRATERRW